MPAAAREAKGCEVDKIAAEDGKIEFDRPDERLPLPVPDEARAVVPFYPVILELSQYTLKVTGPGSAHTRSRSTAPWAAAVTAEQLEAGVNLTRWMLRPKPTRSIR